MKRTPSAQPLFQRLAALSEPLRLRIAALLDAEELAVGEIAKVVQVPQSTVSRHLKALSDVGLISRRGVGTTTLYRLAADDLDPEARAIWLPVRAQLADLAESREDRRRLAAVVAERPTDSRAFFGRIAGEWDELRGSLFGDRFTLEALLGLVPPGWVAADLGCGTGDAAAWLAPVVARVHAIDSSETMLRAARKRLAGFANVEFAAGTLESLPLPDASVDAAVCVLVLHHLDDPSRALREFARVLRADRGGGVALVIDMVSHGRAEYRRVMGHRHLGFAPDALASALREAGFSRTIVRELARDPDAKGPGLFAAVGWLAGSRDK